jgi:hypothetical protein
MDDLIDRVTSGRIFKQIAEYAFGRRGTTTKLLSSSRDTSIVGEAKEELSPTLNLTEMPRSTQSTASALGQAESATSLKFEHSSIRENAASHINLPMPLSHIYAMNYEKPAGKPPLTARYPEVFTFVGKDGEVGTGVSLTKVMVWQFNSLFQSEQKMAKYISKINFIVGEREKLDYDVAEINNQLQDLPEGFEGYPALLQAVVRHRQTLDGLLKLRKELNLKIQSLQINIEKAQQDIQYVKNQLTLNWKETLADGGLLELFGEDVGVQTPASKNAVAPEGEARPKSTASEIERYEEEDAREAALNYVTQKQLQLHEAQTRFDSLQDYYVEEYHTYLACVEEGRITASKSEFDAMMLLDARETTKNWVQSEEQLEQARNQARELGLTLDSVDQESCFVDFSDDGYRESLEAQWIAHVDRDWIEKWIEQETEMPEETDCDEWDARTVDMWESVSVVADSCKVRKRIDHWRLACELLEVERNYNGKM